MNKFKTVVGILVVLLSITVYADQIAYVVVQSANADQNIIDVLEDMGHTVDIVDNSVASATNFTPYAFMIVNREDFPNPSDIPVNEYPTLLLNRENLNDWHWSRSGASQTSNSFLQMDATNFSHIITQGIAFPAFTYIVGTPSQIVEHLPRANKAVGISSVVHTTTDVQDAIVGTVLPGARLLDGVRPNAKGLYFGIYQTHLWTSQSEQLFRNSVQWLLSDLVPPNATDIEVFDITNESAKIKWTVDKLSNSTVFYAATPTPLTYTEAYNALSVGEQVVTLTDLNQTTTYYFRVQTCNEDNICDNSSLHSFTTIDITPPYMVQTNVTNLTNESAVINTETSEDATLTIFYGTNQLQLGDSMPHPFLSSTASIQLTDLEESTQYFYAIEMCDASGNCKSSQVFQFTTLDFTAPDAPRNLRLEVPSTVVVRAVWDAPLNEPVTQYHVYMSSSSTVSTFNFAAPDATVTTQFYDDTTANSMRDRYYIVRAEDASGNIETNENVVGKFTVQLSPGNNLVTFPLQPFDTDMNAVMHQTASYAPVSEVARFNAQAQELETAIFNYTTQTWVTNTPFTTMEELQGYFLKTQQRLNFTFVGTPIGPKTVDLVEGLNVVGLTKFQTKTIDQVFPQTPANYTISEVAKRNTSQVTQSILTYYPTSDTWEGESFDIEPGMGYWVKSIENTAVEVTS